MTKLSNGVEYLNPHFPKDFAEYLVANGFHTVACSKSLVFQKGDIRILVQQEQMDVYFFNEQDPGQEGEKWLHSQTFKGFFSLNILGWMMILHAMGIQSMVTSKKNVYGLSQSYGMAMQFVNQQNHQA